jgi:hypothetical protein
MEDIRFFAILDENNVVVNIVTFPKEDYTTISFDMDKKCIWVFNGDTWENVKYSYYIENFVENGNDVNFVETIVGDPQLFLNENFPNSLINDIVIVESEIPEEEEIVITADNLFAQIYPEGYKIKEYSAENPVIVGSTYDEEKNIFT